MQLLTSPKQQSSGCAKPPMGVLRSDSRQLAAGDAFLAWPGGLSDARQYVAAALAQGAAACLVEQDGVDGFRVE